MPRPVGQDSWASAPKAIGGKEEKAIRIFIEMQILNRLFAGKKIWPNIEILLHQEVSISRREKWRFIANFKSLASYKILHAPREVEMMKKSFYYGLGANIDVWLQQ